MCWAVQSVLNDRCQQSIVLESHLPTWITSCRVGAVQLYIDFEVGKSDLKVLVWTDLSEVGNWRGGSDQLRG